MRQYFVLNIIFTYAVFVITLALVRIIPHPPNFTPIIGIAIASPYFLRNKTFAIMLPILAMFFSDFFIGFHKYMIWTYGSILIISISSFVSINFMRPLYHKIFLPLLAAIFFFIMSNFGVWIMSGFYPHDFTGLMTCYTAAIPFFKNTIISAYLFVFLFSCILKGCDILKTKYLRKTF